MALVFSHHVFTGDAALAQRCDDQIAFTTRHARVIRSGVNEFGVDDAIDVGERRDLLQEGCILRWVAELQQENLADQSAGSGHERRKVGDAEEIS